MAKLSKRHLRIAYLTENKEEYKTYGYSNEECGELNSEHARSEVISGLEALGHNVEYVGDIKSLVIRLAQADHGNFPWDLVFNDTSGFRGSAREAQVPGLLEAYNIPFTFSNASTFATCLDKGITKMALEFYGIPTAPFAIISSDSVNSKKYSKPALRAIYESKYSSEILDSFPLFVKPAAEGTSKGIDPSCKVFKIHDLETTVADLCRQYTGQDILIETFLKGREFTVGIAGSGEKSKVIGILETCWNNGGRSAHLQEHVQLGVTNSKPNASDFFTFDLKDKWGSLGNEPVEMSPDPDDPEVRSACENALKAWKALKCRDLGRVDLRSDGFGANAVPCVIEINPLAGLTPGRSCLCVIAQNSGISYPELLDLAVESARERIQAA
ncbi:hypothetical protein H072_4 [Dactylellina haptotyla CBS 200.50]|uniref:ATP-grasp domain-containing protein n=1 Tax=Dactylellina haptotyla (strain CBS 200.50) TaxID=1284197 RepID=S8ASW1_DACHA|nr:hypothetical protein H072_4 [Dactylellina haptotyla CBS 200.50]